MARCAVSSSTSEPPDVGKFFTTTPAESRKFHSYPSMGRPLSAEGAESKRNSEPVIDRGRPGGVGLRATVMSAETTPSLLQPSLFPAASVAEPKRTRYFPI